MKRLRTLSVALALTWTALGYPERASAQSEAVVLTDAVVLSLDDAVQRALASSARAEEAAARAEGGTAGADVRHAAAQPQVSAQAGYTRTNHVDEFGIPLPNNQLRVIYPDLPNNYRTRLDVQWPIYTGGRLESFERAARTDARALEKDTASVRAGVKLEVTVAYWTLAMAVESAKVVRESLSRADAHLADVRNQLGAGLVSPGDVMAAQAQAARQRMLLIQARSRQDVAEAELTRLIGATAGTTIALSTPLDAPPPVPRETADEIARAARDLRPERAALSDRTSAAEQRQTAAQAGKKPNVGIGGGVDYARPNPRIFPRQAAWHESWDASILVNWPLFDGGKTRAEMAEAAAAAKAARARLADFDAMLGTEVRQRRSELESSLAAIAAADEALSAATEARRIAQERFRAGVATNTDVLDAQVTLLQAGLDRTNATAFARIAAARLDRAAGR